MKKKLFFALLSVFILLQGCTAVSNQPVQVDSHAQVQVMGGRYTLVDRTKTALINSELRDGMIAMLKNRGYNLESQTSESDYIITYDYEITGPFEEDYALFVKNSQIAQEDIAIFRNPPNWMSNPTIVSYYLKTLKIYAATSSNKPLWDISVSIKTLREDSSSDIKSLLNVAERELDKNFSGAVTPN